MKGRSLCLILSLFVILSFTTASSLRAFDPPNNEPGGSGMTALFPMGDVAVDALAADLRIVRVDYYTTTDQFSYSQKYNYNAKGQLKSITMENLEGLVSRWEGSYNYNKKNQLIKATETYYSYNYEYNYWSSYTYYYEYVYNKSGVRTNMYITDPLGQPWDDWKYVYDNMDRLTKRIISHYGGGVLGYRLYEYNAQDQRTKYIYMSDYRISHYDIYEYNENKLYKGTKCTDKGHPYYYWIYIYE